MCAQNWLQNSILWFVLETRKNRHFNYINTNIYLQKVLDTLEHTLSWTILLWFVESEKYRQWCYKLSVQYHTGLYCVSQHTGTLDGELWPRTAVLKVENTDILNIISQHNIMQLHDIYIVYLKIILDTLWHYSSNTLIFITSVLLLLNLIQ